MKQTDFQNRPLGIIGENRFKKYAVLMPLIQTTEGPCLLFEKRADSLRRQPGEICFPGGKLERGESPQLCAERETREELCVEASQISILGPGDVFVSPFDIIIYPFIGELQDYTYTFNPAEVAEVLPVPLAFFRENPPEQYKSTIVGRLPADFPYGRIPGGEQYPWAKGSYEVLFYEVGDQVIWGITAFLVRSCVGLIDRYGLAT